VVFVPYFFFVVVLLCCCVLLISPIQFIVLFFHFCLYVFCLLFILVSCCVVCVVVVVCLFSLFFFCLIFVCLFWVRGGDSTTPVQYRRRDTKRRAFLYHADIVFWWIFFVSAGNRVFKSSGVFLPTVMF
jgi:hypothetical protein